MRKRKATAEESICSHNKRITAGLLAAAGKFCLSADVRDYVRERAQEKEANEYSRQLQRKDVYDTIFAKVQAIRQLNLQPEKWNQSQLKNNGVLVQEGWG
jgi:tRNA G46 methylase TrmB